MDDDNPYRSPIADSAPQTPAVMDDNGDVPYSGGMGLMGPALLGWIGVVLAVGVLVTVMTLVLSTTGLPLGGAGLVILALLTPPARLIWVIFVSFQRRRYRRYWPTGARAFLAVMWIINVVLLCLDAALICFFAVCLSMLG